MRKVLKWAGITLGSLVVIAVLVVLGVSFRGKSKAATGSDIPVATLTIPTDSVTVARGMHIARTITACSGCHGERLEGTPFGTPAILVSMSAPNLTRGRGGIGATYTPQDWDRAIRHGVAKDGRRLVIMPSEAYNRMSDADCSALVAYLASVPPVDSTLPPRRIGLLGGTLIGLGAFPLAADVIHHDAVGAETTPAEASTKEYGAYVVTLASCKNCHGESLAGQKGGNGPPPGPSLVAHANTWTAESFRKTVRTGITPEGRSLNAAQMPWPNYANMTDVELDAVWAYIRSLSAIKPATD